MKKFLSVLSILMTILIMIYIYARFIEPELLTVRYETINTDYIKNDEIKILQFSDTHISEYFDIDDLNNAIDKINEENPDIVVFTGDLIDQFNNYENKENIHEIWEILGSINAPIKYAVYGNHDYGGGAEKVYKEIMEKSGFKLLINEKEELPQYNINFIGMDDSIFGEYEPAVISGNMDKDMYNIVLSHEPDVADRMLEYSIDLLLAGHSHGGQVNLPFANYLPSLGEKYVRGFYDFENFRQTKVYVNIGLGTSTIPMRFMAAPELTVITLKGNHN
ncbi:MAG: metallophosphoesterase [Sedimentibacter saalensis]|uniref:metallophosphoesterase n=1 Tax=Sedimentibacter saalensis TaxID=130788 RepID=UPI002B210B55|nr:metallophosphoesterase [Sedimentibacter saalensis]MEA5093602.1 metallophosphoesterase [Sedimentibacter saalensis]